MTYPGAGFVTFSGWALGRNGVQCFLKAVWHVLIWTFDPTPWDLLRYSNFTWPDSSPSNLCIIIAAFDVQHPKLGRIATAILTCQAKFLGGKSWSLTVEKLVKSGGFQPVFSDFILCCRKLSNLTLLDLSWFIKHWVSITTGIFRVLEFGVTSTHWESNSPIWYRVFKTQRCSSHFHCHYPFFLKWTGCTWVSKAISRFFLIDNCLWCVSRLMGQTLLMNWRP